MTGASLPTPSSQRKQVTGIQGGTYTTEPATEGLHGSRETRIDRPTPGKQCSLSFVCDLIESSRR
jgi:hypothetical protein